jgi:hypothetical protein
LICLAAALSLGAPGSGSAQSAPTSRTASIDGVVTDASLVPIPDATASIVGSSLKVVTGANGRFRMLGLPVGEYMVVVNRLGYASASSVVQVAERDTARVAFALERNPIALDTIVVREFRRSPRMTEFDERRRFAQGQFLTQAEIEKRNAPNAMDLLRTFMSVTIAEGKVHNRRAGHGCLMQFYVDDVAMPLKPIPYSERDFPSPKDLAGIEVYANTGTIPVRYARSGASFCGVVLLWTKDGSG